MTFARLSILRKHVVKPHSFYGACEDQLFGLAYQGKDIVCRFIIEYNSLKGFLPLG
jgi:hypothetical protein